MQRTKGATYEREVSRAFEAALGGTYDRNIGQARDGGNDIDVGPLVVECKRRKTLSTIEGWLKQAATAAYQRWQRQGGDPVTGHIPVVVAREDSGKSLVILRLDDFLHIVKGSAAFMAGAE